MIVMVIPRSETNIAEPSMVQFESKFGFEYTNHHHYLPSDTSRHLVLRFPLLLLPSTMPSKQSLDTPAVDLLMCPYSFRVFHLIFSKRGGIEVLLRRVVILILSINLCPVIRRIMWFWNTSMRWKSFGDSIGNHVWWLYRGTPGKPELTFCDVII